MEIKNSGFDPIAWASRNNDNEAVKPHISIFSSASNNVSVSFPNDDIEPQVRQLTTILATRGIDITSGYDNWLKLGFALAEGLGEEGRGYFHELSRQNDGYNAADCDKQYTHCLRSRGNGVTIKTFFQMAKDAGIDLSQFARETLQKGREPIPLANAQESFCASCAIVPSGTNNENTVKTMDNATFDDFMPVGTMAQVAQNPEMKEAEGEVVDCGQTFSDKLRREDLPSFLHPVYDTQSDAVGRDKMLLGTLNVVSGILPESLYSIYDRRKVYAPLYNIVYGHFATSKGDLEAVKQILAPVKSEMRRRYEAEKAEYDEALSQWEAKSKKERGPQPKEPTLRSPFVYANSSAAVVYSDLDANGGWGIMFETEADSLTNMLSKSEYGDYSDLLRKAHHHEACPYKRKGDNICVELPNPRLSIFLTCTGSQLPALLPPGNVANGLASRFLFYALPDAKIEFRNVFEGCDHPIEDIYKDLGNKLLPLYHALQMRREHPIQFIMSKAQQQEFVETFDAVLREQFSMLGEGIQGFIFRIALECFRFAMVLSALRKVSEWDMQDSIFDDDEQAMACDDRDFHTAMTIINCLINHTGRVYAVLGSKSNDPFRNVAEKPSIELQAYYQALPDGRLFKTSEAMDVAKQQNITERTAKRMLGDMFAKFHVLDHPKQGYYVKNSVAADEQ